MLRAPVGGDGGHGAAVAHADGGQAALLLVPARIDVHGGGGVQIAVAAIACTRAVFPHPTSIFIALAYLGPPGARFVRVDAWRAGRGRGSTQQRRCGTQQPPDRAMGAADEPVHDY